MFAAALSLHTIVAMNLARHLPTVSVLTPGCSVTLFGMPSWWRRQRRNLGAGVAPQLTDAALVGLVAGDPVGCIRRAG